MNALRVVKSADRRPPTRAEQVNAALRDVRHLKVQLGRLMDVATAVESVLVTEASLPDEKNEQVEVSAVG